MSRSIAIRSLIEAGVVTTVILFGLFVAHAQVRSSSNYQIQSDSINFGGGLSSSTNYSLESTGGEVATGPSDSTTYRLRAGYQQMQEVFISITSPGPVTMDGSIGGITGGESNGSTTVTVVTDSPSGYQLTIVASDAPAMRKGADTIGDYVSDSSPQTDFIFSTASNEAHFGFSPFGPHVISRYRNNGSNCGVGSSSTLLRCWDGLSNSEKEIARGTGANHPVGTETTLQFKVGLGGGVMVPPGTYVATTTLTALPL